MNDTIDFSLPGPLVWGLTSLGALILASWLIYIALPNAEAKPNSLTRLRDGLGLKGVPPILLIAGTIAYTIIAAILTVGLALLILGTIALPFAEGMTADEVQKEFLFYVLRLAGLTTVLGAVIALPLTVIRLRLTQKQTETATASLFNEKINAATEGLYARRQVTEWRRGQSHVFWQDDIVQRNAAIDRLEGLAQEEPAETQRIARLLSVYVRELSAEVPAQDPPEGATPQDLRNWAFALPKPRSDMEKAAQTLGRLHEHAEAPLANGEIDLRGANLQRCDIRELAFDKALFEGAQLQGASLGYAQLQGTHLGGAQLQGADLEGAQLQGAVLRGAQLQGADLRGAQLQEADLEGAQLQGADLSGAQLQEANLLDAQLQGADLRGAQLQEADLWFAQLQGADLRGAQLQEANLWDAQLQGADLRGARFDDATSLSAATLQGAALREVDFTNMPQIAEHVQDMFGDTSVTLPDGVSPPDHWPTTELDDFEFDTQWRAWQATLPKGWDKPD